MNVDYRSILQFGNSFPLRLHKNAKQTCRELDSFSNEWKRYNPRKKIAREGLSLTSLDGGFSGVPDLDSLREYCIENRVRLSEMSFNKWTFAAELFRPYMEPFMPHVGRCHVIRLDRGGHFPPHRDEPQVDVQVFRMFVPLKNCNPPQTHFMLEKSPLHFDHGRAYFINTCLEHTVFSCSPSMFGVFNIEVNEETIRTLISNMMYK